MAEFWHETNINSVVLESIVSSFIGWHFDFLQYNELSWKHYINSKYWKLMILLYILIPCFWVPPYFVITARILRLSLVILSNDIFIYHNFIAWILFPHRRCKWSIWTIWFWNFVKYVPRWFGKWIEVRNAASIYIFYCIFFPFERLYLENDLRICKLPYI